LAWGLTPSQIFLGREVGRGRPADLENLRAHAEAGVVGLGRLALSRRERMVMVEPRATGMALFTLRAASEVRAAQSGSAEGDLDPEMVAIAGAIIQQRTGECFLGMTALMILRRGRPQPNGKRGHVVD
jgi:hypothetical protein